MPTTSMSMMSKRTWISPSGELPASQEAAAISRSLRLTLPPSKPPSPYSVAVTSMETRVSSSLAIRSIRVPSGGSPTGPEKLEALALDEAGGCLGCLLLKSEIAHDDHRLFAAGPFGLPCDPEVAQVLAEGKESSENPAGPEFRAAKVFRALPEEPGSERVWRSQGRRRRTSRHRGFCAMDSGWLDGLPCYECEFEPRAIGLNERIRLTACMTRNWPHRLLPQLSAIRGLARLRSELAAAFWSGNTTNDIPCFFIDMQMSTGTRGAMRLRSGGYIDRAGPAESEAISRIAELARQAGDAVRGLTEAHGARRGAPRQYALDSTEETAHPRGAPDGLLLRLLGIVGDASVAAKRAYRSNRGTRERPFVLPNRRDHALPDAGG